MLYHVIRHSGISRDMQRGLSCDMPRDFHSLLLQALTYFTLASQQGHTEAELQLGLMHLSGIGVKKDYGIALKHFNAASKSGL